MLLEEFDRQTDAVINPDMVTEKIEDFLEVTISCFSQKLFNSVLDTFDAKKITDIHSAVGLNSVYEVEYKGKRFALFHSFVGNACKCVVFSHNVGITCNKWSEVFGYYDVDKVSQNIGSNHNYQSGYGFGSQYSINVSSNREFIVKPEELARMAINEVYVLDRNARELAYTTIK